MEQDNDGISRRTNHSKWALHIVSLVAITIYLTIFSFNLTEDSTFTTAFKTSPAESSTTFYQRNAYVTYGYQITNFSTSERIGRGTLLRKMLSWQADQLDDFITLIEQMHGIMPFNRSVFGQSYKPSERRMPTFDFPYIIDGHDICRGVEPFLLIMVLSVHTHIDTRDTIRQTYGRAAKPGKWPKMGNMNDTVRLVFLLGRGDKEIKNKIIEDEHETFGDIVQADFIDSYFNLTRKVVTGLRWTAQFCTKAKYILKADEDVFVHVPNLVKMLKKEEFYEKGAVYGHMNHKSVVLREGKWAVSETTYPLDTYPSYAVGNTYVISGHIAARMFYVAGHFPYMNIEDAFVCGILRTFIGAEMFDKVGFTHWFDRKPKPCEFKNEIRISSTKTDDSLKQYIWDEQKTQLKDCYHINNRTRVVQPARPESHIKNRPSFRHSIRDEHIFFNKTSGMYYVV